MAGMDSIISSVNRVYACRDMILDEVIPVKDYLFRQVRALSVLFQDKYSMKVLVDWILPFPANRGRQIGMLRVSLTENIRTNDI